MLKEIEKLLKKVGGKFIIVEEGRPSYVILDFEEFKKLAGYSSAREESSESPEAVVEEKPEEDDLTVEDIPL